jgi:hypothetical protein
MKRILRSACVLLLAFSCTAWGASRQALEKLAELKGQAKRNGWTFNTGYNEALEYSVDQITGLKITANWQVGAHFVTPRVTRDLPAALDWREKAGGLTPIKNQRSCGSCWAFGTVGVLESILKIRDGITVDISEQQLVSCNRDGWGCGGGWFAHKYHVSPGATTTDQFPYSAANVRCKTNVSYPEKIEDWNYVGGSQNTPTTDQMKAAIAAYGPIAVTVSATRSFQAYRSGVYNANDGWSTNHLVVLVGWNDDDKAWILRNSWGSTWGENGYMRIRYGVNKVGELASYVNYKSACTPQPIAFTGDSKTISPGQSIRLGSMPVDGQTYRWTPTDTLDDPTSSSPVARPQKTTTYTLKATSSCGTAERQVTVTVSSH